MDLLRAILAAGTKLVIIGGGYVGLEVAAVAIKHGADVTLIEAAPRVLARVAGLEISAFYEQAHRTAGVAIHTGAGVASLAEGEPGHVGAVKLTDGGLSPRISCSPASALLPNVELAAEAGLKVDNGIWVDEYCRTEDDDIMAIGDCSNHPSSFLGRPRAAGIRAQRARTGTRRGRHHHRQDGALWRHPLVLVRTSII